MSEDKDTPQFVIVVHVEDEITKEAKEESISITFEKPPDDNEKQLSYNPSKLLDLDINDL